MRDDSPVNGPTPRRRDTATWRNGIALAVFVLGLLAFLTPLLDAEVDGRVGLLLVIAAVLEITHGFRRSTPQGQSAAWFGGAITFGMGVLLINAPFFAKTGLLLFLAASFGLDAARYLVGAIQRWRNRDAAALWLLAGIGNGAVLFLILLLSGYALEWTVSIAAGIRLLGSAWGILLSPVFTPADSGETVISDRGLPPLPEVKMLAQQLADEESARGSIDLGWIVGFIATLFAIHIGRMGFDRTFLGVFSPGVAVLGDLAIALILAFIVVIPANMFWRRVTWRLERLAWNWCLQKDVDKRGWLRRFVIDALSHRLRFAIRLRQARFSLRKALSRGLQIGLPLSAIIAATVPVWGMSWYFDTENWAAGMWNSWAEERADVWREAMVRAVWETEKTEDPTRAFAIDPPGARGDFSFLVIGDTGEGDASQHSLRAQYLEVVRQPEIKFVVISSDVVYPMGEMKNYEMNFWLPFMGTTKPVYAIPGNHDWYDALEGFVATFLEPNAARAAMRARIKVDNRITSTTDTRIEELIGKATQFQREYGVPTQLQSAPFFQLQTEEFALFAVDTGVGRHVDAVQLLWLQAALQSARGKIKMAILGHPLYAGGLYTATVGSDFYKLHQLLREHDVAIIMAGDTHDLEHYTEPGRESRTRIHHFVNGGGGAYLSFGTALDWPSNPATSDWAFYPNTEQVTRKIEGTIPRWKAPFWWWTTRFGGWPFSTEWLSAAFDVNIAPFYQSFMVIEVQASKHRIRAIPYGTRGRLHWSDLQLPGDARPASDQPDAFVEWIVEIPTNE